jgi:hypothetical protein
LADEPVIAVENASVGDVSASEDIANVTEDRVSEPSQSVQLIV